MSLLVGGLVVAGLGLVATRSPPLTRPGGTPEGGPSGGGAGWTTDGGAYLTPSMRAFLDRLASAAGGARILVTSGVRSPAEQAAAMATKRKLGDDLFKLYAQDDLVAEIVAVPNDVSAMTQVIAAQVARGRYLSRHMRGDALDLRSRDLDQASIDKIVAAGKDLGAKVIVESTPPHIHMEGVT